RRAEALGSTNLTCTDRTGPRTQTPLRRPAHWTPDGGVSDAVPPAELARAMTECTTVSYGGNGELQGDPTEIALVEGSGPDVEARLKARDGRRRAIFRFDARLR